MPRNFDGNDEVVRDVGALSGFTFGTWAWILKRGAVGAVLHTLAALATGTTERLQIYFDSSPTANQLSWWTGSGSGSQAGSSASSTSVWYLIVFRKATGNVVARSSILDLSTGTWVHASGGNMTDNVAPGAGGTVRHSFDGASEFFNGDIAIEAAWSNVVRWSSDATGDAQIEAAGLQYSLQAWYRAAPSALWVYDQSATSQAVLDRIGGHADQTTLTGTNLSTNTVPFFSYGANVLIPHSAAAAGATQHITPGAVTVSVTPGTTTVSLGQTVLPTATTVTVTAGTLQVSTVQAIVPAATTVSVTPGTLALGRFVSGVAGTGQEKHFVDQIGDPILIRGDTVWALPFNAGAHGGGTTWQSDIDNYMATRAAQGYNVLYFSALGSLANHGVSDTGETWDGELPWDTDPGELNEDYWVRVDRIVTAAGDAGITCWFDAIYGNESMVPPLAGASIAQFGDYGTAIGNRYKNYPNIVWGLGGDFHGQITSWDAELDSFLSDLRATGDAHLVSVENKPEMTSRFDNTDDVLTWGTSNAQYNSVYTYNVTYRMVEYAWEEASPLAVVWTDGHYAKDTAADDKVMRDLVWWAYSSGSRGHINGSEGVWDWDSGALATVGSENWSTVMLPAMQDYFQGLDGWHLLIPDIASDFVTAGRGTKASHMTPGGSGGVYDALDPQDTYVTAGITADGTLAVVYCPVSTTVTIDHSELAAGYAARWVDPADPTISSTATPSGSNYTTPGSNSVGDDDWLLVFEVGADQDIAPAVTTVTVTPGSLTVLLTQPISPAAVTVTVTPGSLTVRRTELISPAAVTVAVTPGSLTVVNAQAVMPAAVTVSVTPGALAVVLGGAINPAAVTVTVTPGTFTITEHVTLAGPTVTVTAGTLRVGPNVTMTGPTVTATPGTLTVVAGLGVQPLGPMVTVTPGALTVTGGTPVFTVGSGTASAPVLVSSGEAGVVRTGSGVTGISGG